MPELRDGEEHRKGQDAQHAQGQLRVDGKDHHQREAEVEHVFIDGIDDVRHEMPDGIHVARLAAHQVAGAVAVVEGEILQQKLAVYRVPHFIKDALRADLEIIGDEEAKHASRCGDEQQDPHQHGQLLILPAADHVVHHMAADHRVDDGESRKKGDQNQTQKDPWAVRPDKRVKPLHRRHKIQSLPELFLRKMAFPESFPVHIS